MKKKTKKIIKKLFQLPLWLDLLITIIGVILGLMFTNVFENNQLQKDHKEAIKQVWDEIRDNQKMLADFNEQLSSKFEAYRVFDKYLDEDLRVLVPIDSIEFFKQQVEPIFETDSTIFHSKHKSRIIGSLEIFVGSRLFGGKLRNSVWNAFSRQPNYLRITEFEIIADLEQIHTFQLEVNQQSKDWKKSLFTDFTNTEKEREKFIMEWWQLVANQKILLSMYKQNLSEITEE